MNDEFFRSIGELQFNFSYLEKLVRELYCTIEDCELYKIPDKSFANLIDWINHIAKAKYGFNEDLCKQITNVLGRAKQVNIQRNNVIHNFWSVESSEMSQKHLNYLLKLQSKNEEQTLDYELNKFSAGKDVDIDEIQKTSMTINKISRDLYILMNNYISNYSEIKKFY